MGFAQLVAAHGLSTCITSSDGWRARDADPSSSGRNLRRDRRTPGDSLDTCRSEDLSRHLERCGGFLFADLEDEGGAEFVAGGMKQAGPFALEVGDKVRALVFDRDDVALFEGADDYPAGAVGLNEGAGEVRLSLRVHADVDGLDAGLVDDEELAGKVAEQVGEGGGRKEMAGLEGFDHGVARGASEITFHGTILSVKGLSLSCGIDCGSTIISRGR